jgi:peptide/nickel transport system substrate-binding protein
MLMHVRFRRTAVALVVLLGTVVACDQEGSSDGTDDRPRRGGEITVLEDSAFAGSWPAGLDPATNTTGRANVSLMSAIYGELFTLTANPDGSRTRIESSLAERYELVEGGKILRIMIRPGVTFSDGTPFDAAAVLFNFERSVRSTCSCAPRWPLAENGLAVEGEDTVVVRFTRPYPAVINDFPVSNVNWIASPTALRELGEERFRMTPVGAGPFTVVENQLSSVLTLERNPSYFKEGLPYLDRLTFRSIGGDQAAYQALLAGQAHAYEGLGTVALLEQARDSGRITVTPQPPTSPYVVQLNTEAAPFDDERARQAIYYATDFEAIAQGVFQGMFPVSQSFTAPGGLFHKESVPGYRGHDLARAKALVQELGGLTIELGTLGNDVAKQVVTALRTQWQAAGITASTKDFQLPSLMQRFSSGTWQAMLQTAGAWDPAAGAGVGFRFSSTSPFSGVKDPHLDTLLSDAEGAIDNSQREKLYAEAAKYISDRAYAPFGLAYAPANLAVTGVQGPGLTTTIPPLAVNTSVQWDQVWSTAT